MNKKVIIIAICIMLITIIGITIFSQKNDEYKISISIIDKNSPDRKVTVIKNNKEVKFDSIYYLDDVLLCSSANPTINMYDVNIGEELKIKLKNNKIVNATVELKEVK